MFRSSLVKWSAAALLGLSLPAFAITHHVTHKSATITSRKPAPAAVRLGHSTIKPSISHAAVKAHAITHSAAKHVTSHAKHASKAAGRKSVRHAKASHRSSARIHASRVLHTAKAAVHPSSKIIGAHKSVG